MNYADERTLKIIKEALRFGDEEEIAVLLGEYPEDWDRLDACAVMKVLSGVLGINDTNYIDHLREWGFSDDEIETEFGLDTEAYDDEIAYWEHIDTLIDEMKEEKMIVY